MEKKIAKIGIIAVLTLALILSSFGALSLGDTFAKEFDVGSSNKITAHAAEKWGYPDTAPGTPPGSNYSFAGGTGTEADPYLISSAQELANLSKLVNCGTAYRNADKHYKLTEDIVLNDNFGPGVKEWTPIGEGATFNGVFDGNGHTISGVYIRYVEKYGTKGLFGTVGDKLNTTATVKNLGVINSHIEGTVAVTNGAYLGGIVGENYGNVINCYNQGEVTTKYEAGGIVGNNGGKIINCYNSGVISGTGNIYGIVARNQVNDGGAIPGFVENCYFLKKDKVTGAAGGELGTTTNCGSFVNNGGVLTKEGDGYPLGNNLLAALNAGATAYNTANPTAAKAAEWIIGKDGYPVQIPGPITPADSFAGGDGSQGNPWLIGTAPELAYMAQEVNKASSHQIHYKLTKDIVVNDGIAISKPWVTIGMVSSPFQGTFDGDGHTVSGIYINTSDENQGLFGATTTDAAIKNVGVINSSINGFKSVGGIVGWNKGEVTNCYNQGDIGVKGDAVENSNFGGIAGYNEGAVSNCYSSGKVTGKGIVGGVVGFNNSESVNHCYFLTGTIYIGGTLQTPEKEKAVGHGSEFNCAKFSTAGALDVLIDSTHYYDLLEALNLVANTNKTWYGVTGGYPSFNLNLYVDANKVVYANGLPITIKAGRNPGYTNIYFDDDLNTPIKLSEVAPTDAGYDLSTYTVYGGGITPITGNTSVTMTGGKVKSIYGGGSGARGTVSGTKTVKVSGDSIIGADNTSGIIIDGGTTPVANGVVKFEINGNLGAGAKINVVLPSGYGLGTVATKGSDLTVDEVAKFTLVGATLKKLVGSGTNLDVATDLPQVTINEDKQRQNYTKENKEFRVSSKEGVTNFTIQYRKNETSEAFSETRPINAGFYDVKVTRATDGTYADFDKEILKGLEIVKSGVGLRWTEPTDLVYDKTAKTPSVVVMQSDLYGDDICTVTAGLTVGDNNINVSASATPFTFTATALSNPNYTIETNAISDPYIITARPLKNIKVSKEADKNVDFSNIALTADHCADLVSGDNIIITFKTSKADKGTYTGSEITDFTIAGTSAGNYSVDVADVTATITGKPIPAFNAMASKEYTKLAQKPTVTIVGLTLDTNYTLSWEYKVAGGNKFTAVTGEPEFINAGTYKVTATGLGEYDGSTQTAEYEITAKVVVIEWKSPMEYTYTGSPIVPNVEVTGFISGDICEVSVKEPTVGSNINVGTFKMTAKALSNSNYKLPIPADSGEYKITKVETNIWTTPLKIANIYVGGTLAPQAVPTVGEVVYTYYTDNKDAKGDALDVAPTEVGTYWVTAKVAGTSNYVEIAESEAVKFTISQKPSVSEGGSITPKDILWTGIVNDLKFKDDPIVEKSVDSDIIPKNVLLELQKVDKTLKLSANGETLVITSKQVKPLTFDKAMYSFAELKAMLEVKPEVTPTPTPTPTEKPTEPTEPTANKCWLCGACPMFLGICLWIWLAVAIVAVAAVVVFIVLKKKKKNDKK